MVANRFAPIPFCIDGLEIATSPTTTGADDKQTTATTVDPEAAATTTATSTESTAAVEVAVNADPIEAGGVDDEDEFEPSIFDGDSVGDQTDSTSVTSSVYEHSFQNGRRYHKFRHGRYPIPNDETEQNREDMLHAMMLEVTDGKLFFAPISDNPNKIIDLGTGTGIWAIEMGDRYPSAEITGLDLSPIQPQWVPSNVRFLVDDVEDTWLNGNDFDFVHLRNMVPILKSPVGLLRNAYEHMKPGGWVELQDVDGQVHCDDNTVPEDWPLVRFTHHLVDAFAKFGTNSHAAVFGRQYLEQAGFVNIQHHTVKLPYGTWPKDKTMRLVGMYYRTACEEFFPAVGAIHFELLGWSKLRMEVLFAECRNAMRDPNVHAYGKMHFWSGQKPRRFNAANYYSESGKPGHIKTQHGYFLDESVDLAALDTTFFRMPKTEVERADPQQRLLLELTRECFESAGETDFRGKTIGTFVGCFGEDHLEILNRDTEVVGQYKITGYGDFMLSNRLSYEYDLKGPSMTIRTGCSSALIGLHEACMSISHGQCNSALVAGSNLIMAPSIFVSMSEQGVLSPNGSCRTFDAAANGYARGEAVNVVFIKRLSDAIRDGNPIRAVIRGTSSNADGKTPSLTIPSFESHEAMIRRAYSAAVIDASDISQTGFVECHGTGTAAGDPIETTAVAKVFGDSGVYIGSCKPNIGHSEGASGITSLIKAVLALEHRTIPPNIKFDIPNPKIPFDKNNLKVPVTPTPWPEDRIERASVNSFGIGGANAHVVIESAISFLRAESPSMRELSASPETSAHLVVYSANTANSLRRQVVNNQRYISDNPAMLDDIAYTLSSRRIHLPHRAFSVFQDGSELSTSPFAKASPSPADLVLVFTGQGAQWPRMGAELLNTNEAFARSIRQMDKILSILPDGPSWTLADELMKPAESSSLHKAYLAQPVCTAVQVALVDTLKEAGVIQAFAVVGHSSGEMAAAYASGRLTAKEAIIAAYYRGIASSEVTKSGAMAAVGMGRAQTSKFLVEGVVIACENSPSSVTVSGDADRVEEVLAEIRKTHPEVLARTLKVEKAYHSHHMQEVGDRYMSMTSPYLSRSSSIEGTWPLFFSSVTGEKLQVDEPTNAKYWRSNLESPVLFDSAVSSIIAEHQSRGSNKLVFLEVGPHSAMAGPLRQILKTSSLDLAYASCLIRSKNSTETFLAAIGQLWQHGVSVDFNRLTNPKGNAHVVTNLPSYPWQHDHSLLFSSRISDEWKFRKFPKHEILGVRVPESSENDPIFRNVLTLNYVPWIRDHNIKGDIIFPCAGYVGMAGEAARQLHTGDFAGFAMRNVVIDMAMVLSESKSTEIITSLRRERLTDSLDSSWWEFTIASHNGSTWSKHCSGQVKALEDATRHTTRDPMLKLPRLIGPGKWYQALRNVGANYGPYFQGLKDVACSPTEHRSHGTATHTISNESYYSVHPTKVDFFLQLFSVAAAKGVGHKLDKMNVPTFIESLEVFTSDAEIEMEVQATQSPRGVICGGGEGITSDGRLVLALKGVKLSPLENDTCEEDTDPHAGARTFWQPDVDFLKMSDLIEAHPSQDNLIHTQDLTLNYIQCALSRLDGVETMLPHLVKFLNWMKKQPLPERVVDVESTFSSMSQIESFGSFVVAMKKVLDNIVPIFLGQAEPLEVLMPNNVLTEVYNSLNITDRRPLFQAFGHLKPNLRILEIGAGTGGTTNKVLEWLRGPTGALLYSEYTYTDISAGFFATAQERFKKYPNMTFKPLDISKDPIEQGFEPESYDLILAANVLHATPSLQGTLTNVRKILHPEGRLYMEELSHDALPLNFVMGVLPGWWLGEEDGRPDQPYVTPDRWDTDLRKAGFDGLDNIAYDSERPNNLLAFMTARPTQPLRKSSAVTILHDAKSTDLAADLQKRLVSIGCEPCLHEIADGPLPTTAKIITTLDLQGPFLKNIEPELFAAFQSLVAQASTSNAGIFWLTRPSQLRCADPRWSQIIGTARSIRTELNIDFVTCEIDESSSISTAIEVFRKFCRQRKDSHQPEYEYSIEKNVVHVSRVYPANVNDELRQTPHVTSEREQGGPSDGKREDHTVLDLRIGKYGRLNTLSWKPRRTNDLAGDEVIVESKAGGMNFRDVLIAMGIVDPINTNMGLEAAGIVRRIGPETKELVPGDRVFIFGGGCFSSNIPITEKLCVKIPDSLSFEEAATMPCVFSTVIHGLLEVGHLASGDSVLIHSACGGVGLAAIQICKMIGADIFCTVGNEEKVQFLESSFGIPRDHIFNSRDASFLPDTLKATGGRGVDVVLNSLSGELLHASWSCVAEFGRMIEIGKRDFIGNGKLALNPFALNRSYHGVDLGHMIDVRPEKGNILLKKIVQLYEQGHITALSPIKTFKADAVEECFRYMQKGQHIGKIVLQMENIPRTTAKGSLPTLTSKFDSESSYLLVGGLGGLGRHVSNWMVEHGAKHLVYLSRQGSDAEENQSFFRELEAQGCSATAVKGSVVNIADVEHAIATSPRPIRGVINMTMILRDQGFTKMTHEEWTTAVNPKVRGTWNLHKASVAAGLHLDFFLLFSSISGIYGQAGQSNYAGANTFLDAFVQYRHRLGLTAASLVVGAMTDCGYLAEHPLMLEKLMAQGVFGVQIPQLLDSLAAVISPSKQAHMSTPSSFVELSQLIFGHRSTTSLSDPSNRVTWKEDRRMGFYHIDDLAKTGTSSSASNSSALQTFLKLVLTDPAVLSSPDVPAMLARQIATQLFRLLLKPVETEEEIDVNMSLQDAGLDSLVAVEMRSWWKGVFGFDISVLEMLGMGSLLALGERAVKGLRSSIAEHVDEKGDAVEKHDTEGYLKLKMP
ncbi:polyketide synthase [Colletotrichum karsti]|uniref:Polyketide synthase n=1 Tax=Colletotrichum karsti TaxID=1095194 RepID=A0A9P6HY70_9PEZI|nr:polyketide synthase [Colletotrichum karsti]KAF9872330.1 polyketide synthase [Colletotrichum karsti]